jgi:hypothetical protein
MNMFDLYATDLSNKDSEGTPMECWFLVLDYHRTDMHTSKEISCITEGRAPCFFHFPLEFWHYFQDPGRLLGHIRWRHENR